MAAKATPVGKLPVNRVRVSELSLDAHNPRLRPLLGDGKPSQNDLLRILWRNMAVDEIALSIAANGYFEQEPLFVAPEDGVKVVIEGNRRLAAIRLLTDATLRKEIDARGLPELNQGQAKALETAPVVFCKRDEMWRFVGFKHVNGPAEWDSFSKAEYIAWVHIELGRSLEEIANTIGDQHSTVERLFRGLMVLRQAEEHGLFARANRKKRKFSFSHLYTGLALKGISQFLGLNEKISPQTKSPVPKGKEKNLAELLLWLYGDAQNDIAPVVRSQNPDLRRLDQALQSANGIAALRNELPLESAVKLARGDSSVFREALVLAKTSLEEAKGKVVTGFAGEPDLLDTAEDIERVAVAIVDEMRRHHRRPGEGEEPRRAVRIKKKTT